MKELPMNPSRSKAPVHYHRIYVVAWNKINELLEKHIDELMKPSNDKG